MEVQPDAVDWTFGGSWPFRPRWFATPAGRLHYVDEGPRNGLPVVLIHGNPTWGYLYRHFVPPLVERGYRVIVPDHLGFGRSDKPPLAALYAVREHAERLDAFLESLDLGDVTLGVHDWGGPTGLGWATRHPQRISRLFIMNTFAHRPPRAVALPLALRLFRAPGIGELMVQGGHAFVRAFLFRAGVVKRERMTSTVRAAYHAPHPTWGSRAGILRFPREIPVRSEGEIADFCGDVHDGLAALRDRSVLITWAMKDVGFTSDILDELWLTDFPNAEVVRIEDAGHYLQEDAHERIVPALIDFLSRR